MIENKIIVPSILIKETLHRLIAEASFSLHPRYLEELKKMKKEEHNPNALWILDQLLENVEVARKETLPLCQDTGYVTVFFFFGKGICLPSNIQEVVDQAVREVYEQSLLRASMVSHPLKRVNTKDNTPAVIHIEQTPNEGLEINVMLKGAGSENASALKMLSPAEGEKGIRRFILQTLKKTAWNACPPLILGIGIGGTMEKSAYLAKKAILNWSKGKEMDDFERSILEDVNRLGVGPGGVGGKLTCLGVSIETAPCHIATIPVALNVQCYAMRLTTLRLSREEIINLSQRIR